MSPQALRRHSSSIANATTPKLSRIAQALPAVSQLTWEPLCLRAQHAHASKMVQEALAKCHRSPLLCASTYAQAVPRRKAHAEHGRNVEMHWGHHPCTHILCIVEKAQQTPTSSPALRNRKSCHTMSANEPQRVAIPVSLCGRGDRGRRQSSIVKSVMVNSAACSPPMSCKRWFR